MPSNLDRRARRKKQTRLSFDPIEPSSSCTMSPARVRYQGWRDSSDPLDLTSSMPAANEEENDVFPSGKKFAVIVETPPKDKTRSTGRLPFKPLMATEKSSPQSSPLNSKAGRLIEDLDSDLEILPMNRRRQGFDSEKNSSEMSIPIPTPQVDLSLIPAGAPSFIHRPQRKGKRRLRFDGAGDSSDESDVEVHIQTLAKSRNTKSKRLSAQDSDESPLESPPRAKVKNGVAVTPKKSNPESDKKRAGSTARSFISGGSSYSAPITNPQPSKSRATQKAADRRQQVSSIILSDDDDDFTLPTPRKTQSSTRKKGIVNLDDDSDDPRPTVQSLQRRGRRTANIISDGDASSDEMPDVSNIFASLRRSKVTVAEKPKERHNEEEDDDVVIRSSVKRRRAIPEDVESNEYIPLSSPLKRIRRRNARDVEDDDSRTSRTAKPAVSKRQTRQQQQKRSHRTPREKQMELLKRRKLGEQIDAVTDSGTDDEARQAVYDTDSDLQALAEFEDEEYDSEAALEEVRQSIRPNNRMEYDDDFVVEDDEEPLGVPGLGLHDIPLEFTHQAHKPLKEHFKDAVEWMVQNKVNPGFPSNDPIYKVAFKKLDDEVRGYARSKYSSAAWSEPFTRALWARPIFYESDITPGSVNEGQKCDACGRSGHPAKYEIQFAGAAYVNATLEEVDNNHSSDDNDDGEGDEEDAKSVNSKGQAIPPVSTSWFVGRFCKANAETAHSLIHWKFALNEWVIGQLEGEGHLAPAKLQERVRWSKSRLSRFANSVVDEWAEGGQVKGLWRDFKANLEAARESKPDRWSTA